MPRRMDRKQATLTSWALDGATPGVRKGATTLSYALSAAAAEEQVARRLLYEEDSPQRPTVQGRQSVSCTESVQRTVKPAEQHPQLMQLLLSSDSGLSEYPSLMLVILPFSTVSVRESTVKFSISIRLRPWRIICDDTEVHRLATCSSAAAAESAQPSVVAPFLKPGVTASRAQLFGVASFRSIHLDVQNRSPPKQRYPARPPVRKKNTRYAFKVKLHIPKVAFLSSQISLLLSFSSYMGWGSSHKKTGCGTLGSG
ncbi:hypothetical protein SISNIDRAFT_468500 [Sistotremastrum niveocremeum HHB9708]|uniref:Uncharacterized protein n=1 Tax=Sistotremastrum niveocremeum HHB9708 TaxID=1314777 RepID=A0A164RBP1_9AGAM|nr:hypothetical protein SISNIDRAFT_468500 [Sistotremastrum niveocremeum HHB9708]